MKLITDPLINFFTDDELIDIFNYISDNNICLPSLVRSLVLERISE